MALAGLSLRTTRLRATCTLLVALLGCTGVTEAPDGGDDVDNEPDEHTGNADDDTGGDGDGDGDGDDPLPGDGDGDGDGSEPPDEPDEDGGVPPQGPACKRGVAYGYHSPADLEALSAGVSWWYNWAPRPDMGVANNFTSIGVDFVPMVWGGGFDTNDVIDAIPDSARYLLGFNEPNFGVQADMTPEQAAAAWPALEEIAQAKGLALVSPALNFCGGDCNETDPFVYLDKFFAACDGCKVDALAAHWYACTPEALTWYLGELEKYDLPIWLTEFSCGDDADRSLEKQKKYMEESVAVLEAHPKVARYAWFAGRTDAIPNVNLLGADGKLSELGQLYVSLPRASGCTP